jgi:hypothetical protein
MGRLLFSVWSIAVLFTGCSTVSQGIDVARLPPPYKVIIYDNGNPVAERELPAGSEGADQIAHWLESNRLGWTSTPATYVPQRLVRGDSFSLNFGEKHCVLNYGGRQLYKSGDMSELSQVFQN